MGRIGMLSVRSGKDVDGKDQQAPAEPKAPVEAQRERAAGMHVVQDNSAAFQAAVDTAVKAALAGNRNREKSTACNNWDYTGACSYGDRCRFSHDTVAGYKGTNAGDQAEDAGELNNELELKECNNCIEPGCKGCGLGFRKPGAIRLNARRPGLHAIGWKRELQLTGDDSD